MLSARSGARPPLSISESKDEQAQPRQSGTAPVDGRVAWGFGGAGGKILSSFFEYNASHPGTYTFTDLCHQLRTEFLGMPRVFTSFSQLGEEDAYSRIPLGVHFRMDCEVGLEVGRLCAQRVLEMPWKK